ncbi:uncharacterized protein K452DRAFT_293095 [Aplosporella prunicola CBS 121167]|uniref:Uncharacterized protein n=1 Tax=Aplosporella prunicola CBS 121167 TaxID=1176127 RepID=A0A6A6AXR8_9PEZI|nr:uncharacterized protein K452DRAFT_293285 [Aplosporella prunicola CBS 121167]XP_033391332.1 uncharacterized protein K452DRAFT_293095 [Aplosporella prunicola CBS 121167]KAF2135361.1 hypothetical protein K452DRAFT_293285 [Aplosporella prunicola CBS 121167]KAF2135614.1 hypothetical protein K452DRAFT_293095 [Aplosporella prunicola CBS 121167]
MTKIQSGAEISLLPSYYATGGAFSSFPLYAAMHRIGMFRSISIRVICMRGLCGMNAASRNIMDPASIAGMARQ